MARDCTELAADGAELDGDIIDADVELDPSDTIESVEKEIMTATEEK